MPRNNKYYGAILAQAVVSVYYPDDLDFDGFVFQQMIGDGNKADDSYTLVGYATFKTRSPILLDLGATNGVVNAKATVQFANMKLDLAGLAKLYPSGEVNADITITPIRFYGNTGYVVYDASTPGTIKPKVPNTTTLNPSPPYSG